MTASIPVPYTNQTFEDWAALLIQVNNFSIRFIPNESKWQQFATDILNETPIRELVAPIPAWYAVWSDWAADLSLCAVKVN